MELHFRRISRVICQISDTRTSARESNTVPPGNFNGETARKLTRGARYRDYPTIIDNRAKNAESFALQSTAVSFAISKHSSTNRHCSDKYPGVYGIRERSTLCKRIIVCTFVRAKLFGRCACIFLRFFFLSPPAPPPLLSPPFCVLCSYRREINADTNTAISANFRQHERI